MRYDKEAKLIDLLLERTEANQLEWSVAVEADEFQVSFADKSVRISRMRTRDGSAIDYVIELINEDGNVVDTFRDTNIDRAMTGNTGGPWYKKMRDLYDFARRSALGADKVLDAILNDLDQTTKNAGS
jgi:hypothetical protein